MLSHHLDNQSKIATAMKVAAAAEEISKLDTSFKKRVETNKLISKLSKRMSDKRFKKTYDLDTTSKQMNETLNEVSVKDETDDEFDKGMKQRENDLKSMVPTCNKDATSLDEVYNLDDLIDEDLLQRLDNDAIRVLEFEDLSSMYVILIP